jgi:hypothetical protein
MCGALPGTTIPTEDIFVRDTEYLPALGADSDELDDALEGAETDLDPDDLQALQKQLAEFGNEHPDGFRKHPSAHRFASSSTSGWKTSGRSLESG